MKKQIYVLASLLVLVSCAFILFGCSSQECVHEWGEWNVVTESSCSAQGSQQRKCLSCDEIQTDNISITDHVYDTDNLVWTWNGYESAFATLYCKNDTSHTRQINANITENTVFPTCTENGAKTYTATVKIDDKTYTSEKTEAITSTGHNQITLPAVSPSCTQEGLSVGVYCSVCNTVFEEQKKIPAINHDYDMENIVWNWDGYDNADVTIYCKNDNTHTKQVHAVITSETISATCTKDGKITYNATIKIDAISATAGMVSSV